MSGPKKRKVDSECRVFKREWTTKYFFTKVRSMPVCLICQETLAVFKEYNLSRHFATKHGNYASKQSPQEREATAQRLMAKLQAQQNVFHRQTAIQETTTKASFMLSFKLAKASKPLSEGEFLKECMIETAVWELKEEIGAFLKLKGKSDEFTELSDKNWLCDFAFAVDIFSHLNELNVKLQGKDQYVHDMYTNVKAFKSKLIFFSRQISDKVFAHFATLATQKETIQNVKKYSKSLDDLHTEFCRRFSDVEKIDQSLQLVACPLSQNPETAPEEVQLELIDLQSDFVLKEKFSSLELRDFYASLNEATFPNIQRMAQKILVLFGSTYVCEQTFSVMNINKAPHRSSLTDEHLRSILRIATTKLTPDFDALAKKGDQQHCSH
uniref:Uncharacterized protein n=1 Tax=Myotis myotis TaxID=51298 RepID=A0A7J8AMM0_MYOMY|nr:hypothetical protein mMyoMyo1_007962 [Myotis myotis]